MSDTTTPSAAEVMGFLPGHEFIDGGPRCSWCETHIDCVDAEVGPHCPDNSAPPTPDDMLAFLWDRGYDVGEWDRHGGGIEVTIYSRDTDSHHTESAPTLHAALEQAVIAVGRAK